MKIAHNIKLSVFAHEEEDAESIRQKMLELVPFDLEKEKLQLKQTNAQGFQEKRIIIYELTLEKERHTNKFLEHLKGKLEQSQIGLLKRQAGSRLDQELNFFIRLDKTILLREDRYWLTDSGNCFHIKISIGAYPATRETALDVLNAWLG